MLVRLAGLGYRDIVFQGDDEGLRKGSKYDIFVTREMRERLPFRPASSTSLQARPSLHARAMGDALDESTETDDDDLDHRPVQSKQPSRKKFIAGEITYRF